MVSAAKAAFTMLPLVESIMSATHASTTPLPVRCVPPIGTYREAPVGGASTTKNTVSFCFMFCWGERLNDKTNKAAFT